MPHQPYLPKSGLQRDQRGFGLVETVVSIAVLSITSVALVGAMATGFLGFRVVEKDVTAGRLAVHQMEYTKAYTPYSAATCVAPCAPPCRIDYPLDTSIIVPAGYILCVAASKVVDDPLTTGVNEARDPNTLERITVTVMRSGATIRKLEDYKQNR